MVFRASICWAFVLFAGPVIAEQATVRYLDLPADAQAQTLAADSAGNLFIVSNVTEPSGKPQIRVLKTDSQGRTLASMDFGGSAGGMVAGAAVDPQGNVVIAGTTTSTDFPLVAPLISNVTRAAGFVVKFDSQLKNILFSTLLGGTQNNVFSAGTSVGALALDQAGNMYVTGSTSNTDFPITPGAFQTQPPDSSAFGAAVFAFLTEISSDGKQFIFSTYFGNSGVMCIGGSHCIGAFGHTSGSAIAIDASGNIVIAGSTTAYQLPVTSGVYAQQCGCTSDLPAGFLAKFATGGAKLQWATYLPITGIPLAAQITIRTMAIDTSGNVLIGGSLADASVPTTTGALQSIATQEIGPGSQGFLVKFDSAASRLLFSTYFGNSSDATSIGGLLLDLQGNIWVTGNSAPGDLPVSPSTPLLGPSYLASLAADGSAVLNLFTAPSGTAGQAITISGGNIVALGSAAAFLIATPSQGPSLVGIATSAGLATSNAVAPYELVSLFGYGIGPATPATAQVIDNVISTSLAGVQVLFDGIPAPLLYVSATQINAVVPEEVMGHDTTAVQILTSAGTLNGPTMLVRPAQPGIFPSGILNLTSLIPYAAALNQDGSVNSASNPAAFGSIVSIWATGGGTSNPRQNGTIATAAEGGFPAPVSILSSNCGREGTSLEILYAGDAPGTVVGVSQVNFRLPEQTACIGLWTFQLQVGDALSQPFTIYLQQ